MKATQSIRPIATLSLGLLFTALLAAPRCVEAASKVVIPEGTPVTLQLVQTLSSESNHKGDAFELRVAEDVKVDGHTVIHAGARAEGTVTLAQASGRLARQGRLGIELDSLQIKEHAVEIRAVRPAEGADQPRARRFFPRIAAPLTRVAKNVTSVTRRELVSGNAAELLNAGDGKVGAIANHALGMDDGLTNVELGGTGRAAGLVNRGVRGLERVGTGYVAAILSGPTGLLKKGSIIEMPAGTTIHAVVTSEATL